ncbi:uncharacterized protein G6M90_00g060920 [Metarhizium brunneum]|uniref:Uncharacterized protein n=1 Tax=Metarhizium brunneum TaxID=500148 RepID=A0A7D5Z520_9HYPO|nr:hypothetical protein G6M90_00g060920 [Metarhizium brunneum]
MAFQLLDPRQLPPRQDGYPQHPYLALQRGAAYSYYHFRSISHDLLSRHLKKEHRRKVTVRRSLGYWSRDHIQDDVLFQSWPPGDILAAWRVSASAVEKPTLAPLAMKDAELDRQAKAICAAELQRLTRMPLYMAAALADPAFNRYGFNKADNHTSRVRPYGSFGTTRYGQRPPPPDKTRRRRVLTRRKVAESLRLPVKTVSLSPEDEDNSNSDISREEDSDYQDDSDDNDNDDGIITPPSSYSEQGQTSQVGGTDDDSDDDEEATPRPRQDQQLDVIHRFCLFMAMKDFNNGQASATLLVYFSAVYGLSGENGIEEFLSLVAHGISLSRADGPAFLFEWSKDRKKISWDSKHHLTTDSFRSLLVTAAKQVTKQCKYMLFGWQPSQSHFQELRDRLSDKKAGYSFVTDPANGLSDAYLQLIKRACIAPMDGLLQRDRVGSGGRRWDMQAITKYIEKHDKLLKDLMITVHGYGGQGSRISELLTLRHANTSSQLRGVVLYAGSICCITQHFYLNFKAALLLV